jgi:hypothetical protein
MHIKDTNLRLCSKCGSQYTFSKEIMSGSCSTKEVSYKCGRSVIIKTIEADMEITEVTTCTASDS